MPVLKEASLILCHRTPGRIYIPSDQNIQTLVCGAEILWNFFFPVGQQEQNVIL